MLKFVEPTFNVTLTEFVNTESVGVILDGLVLLVSPNNPVQTIAQTKDNASGASVGVTSITLEMIVHNLTEKFLELRLAFQHVIAF